MLLSESSASNEDDDDGRLVEPLGREEEDIARETAKKTIKERLEKYQKEEVSLT